MHHIFSLLAVRDDRMKRENIILLIIMMGTLMAAIDSSVVLLALPTITKSLGATLATSIWTILIYLLVLSVVTIQLGKLGDLYGRGRIFNLGFAVFTIGSFLCGASGNITELVFFRLIQALGAAMLGATSSAIIADTFDKQGMGRAYGYTAVGFSVGSTLGIVLGGFITALVGWQYVFYINVPFGILALIMGIKYIKDDKEVEARTDITGMVMLALGLSMITYGGVDFAANGLTNINLGLVIFGFVICAFFLYREFNAKSPMIDFHSLKNRVLKLSIVAAFLQSLGYMSIVFLLILYMQGIKGLDPLTASLLLVPGYILTSLISPSVGKFADKHGSRLPATVGLLFMCAAILIYYTLDATSSDYIIVAGSVVAGIGAAMFWPSNNRAVMTHADPKALGSTSGVLRFVSNIGMVGSYILMITVASASISRSQAFSVFLGTSNLIGGVSQAFLVGIHNAMLMSLLVLLLAALMSWYRGKESMHDVDM